MIVDAHVHFWKFDKKNPGWITDKMKTLRQDYLPSHLQATVSRNGVDAVIAVQSEQSEVETLFLTELAKTHSFIKGVVGWVDLSADNIASRLEYFSQFPQIKGFRHILQDEDIRFFESKGFLHGISLLEQFGYTYDLLIYPSQLAAASELVSAFPGQSFVLDHCAKPDIAGGQLKEWQEGIEKLSSFPNVYCKLSGLFTEAVWKSWSPKDFYPYLDHVFRLFGTDRLIFASDWPVMLLSGAYVQWKSLLEKYMEEIPEEDREAVFGANARRLYKF